MADEYWKTNLAECGHPLGKFTPLIDEAKAKEIIGSEQSALVLARCPDCGKEQTVEFNGERLDSLKVYLTAVYRRTE